MDFNELLEQVWQELLKRLNTIENKEKAVVIGPLPNERDDDSFEYITYTTDMDASSYDTLYITKLSNARLSRLALGMADNEEEEFILSMLLRGKKLMIDSKGIEYRQFQHTAQHALLAIYKEYEQKLKEFGAQLINEQQEKRINQEEALPVQSQIKKKVITENDIQRAHFNKIEELMIPSTSIVTPLAQDFIRECKMVITREKGE
ncbi:hypothetical protein [Pontibacillus litoralis]|uniref:Ethanolamine utilization protein n=1 Tax=Pontibacillus litoralis JSM 072002 TaxID=1385512 RepID=A0A0A5HLP5_9BACI|nr:hypothetical protein [Pontibacillus litoralis]KGX84512.1 hypothetical protein N784_13375 [Pontibacillus litoralis JSM 072002]